MRLPAPLAPWAAQLAVFPSDIAIALGPAIRRLSAAIGGWPAHPEGDLGDPDGFDGLSRRGSYERLLASEWLFADELPDEFLRRAGMGEHTFLRLARPQPAAHRHSVVLFDAGPSQLGAPRIAHLAALIVLARRAGSARAGFTWGILQQPPESDGAEITPKSLRGLLSARSMEEPPAAALETWRAHVDRRWRAGDVWIVGPTRWERPAATLAWSSVSVSDVYDAAARRLEVSVRGPRRMASHLTLELPAADVCTRVLRNPAGETSIPAVTRGAVDPTNPHDVVFAMNGNRLIARSADGRVSSFIVPSSSSETPRRPITLAPGDGTVIGANQWGRRLTIARQSEGSIRLDEYSKKGGRRIGSAVYHASPVSAGPGPTAADAPLSPCLRVGRDHFVRDAAGALRRLTGAGSMAQHVLVAARVAGLTPTPSGLVFVESSYRTGPWQAVRVENAARTSFVVSEAAAIEAHIGFDRAHLAGYPPIAVSEDGRLFRLWENGVARDVSSLGGRVLGVYPDGSGRFGLVVAEAEPARLVHLGPDWKHKLVDPPPYSRAVAFCPVSGRVAFAGAHGELSIVSLERGALLGRWVAG